MRHRPDVLIVEHRLGFVMANAGVDHSNVDPATAPNRVLLLPRGSRRLGRALRERLAAHFGDRSPSSSATASAGLAARHGRRRARRRRACRRCSTCAAIPICSAATLRVTEIGFADEIAAAASLLMGQADEAQPAVLVRGLDVVRRRRTPAASLVRAAAEDLFR